VLLGERVPTLNIRDATAGAIFIVIGAAFALGTRGLDMGTPLKMGPGFFPLMLAGILMLLGLGIVATAFAGNGEPVGTIPWRGLAYLLPAPVAFGMTVQGLGLVGALALAVAISSFASRRATPLLGAVMTLGLTAFCIAVFTYGLGLPLALEGPWLKALRN
jgi:hypothetical protein